VLTNLNLILLFDFYLAITFMLSVGLRVRQYRAMLGIVGAVPGRWPRLFDLIKQHKQLFITWSTLAPLLLALSLMAVQMLASRFLFPEASMPPFGLTVGRLAQHAFFAILIGLLGAVMLACDVYCTFVVGEVDRPGTEKYLDQAEHWLKSWKAPVVRVFTLGYINPRRMVAVEVRKSLEEAARMLNWNLWWVCLQTGLRIVFGLALWATYAWTRTV
jgi:hypothetical protein